MSFRKQLRKLNPLSYLPLVREVLALRSRQGPYRFVVRQWSGINDLNLASRVMETEYFKQDLIPVALPVREVRSILVLAPHQDDEAIGAGGALLLASAAGVPIHIVFVTDGEEHGFADSIGIRDREAEEVCRRLGASKLTLAVSNLAPKPSVADLEKLAGIIGDLKPAVVMTPWLLDSPIKHRMTNHLLWLAGKRRKLPAHEVWGYQVHNSLLPNGYVDITEVAGRKRELIECYRSQNEMFYRYDHIAMGMAAANARFVPDIKGDNIEHYAELFFALPSSEFEKMIGAFYFRDLQETYRGNLPLIGHMESLHRSICG